LSKQEGFNFFIINVLLLISHTTADTELSGSNNKQGIISMVPIARVGEHLNQISPQHDHYLAANRKAVH